MNPRRLIVDGYSLLHHDQRLAAVRVRDFDMARRRLARRVEELAGGMAETITVVFDGREAGPGGDTETTGVEILFSPANRTADTVIERLVCEDARPATILVISSDRGVLDTVSAAGAQTMSCLQFLETFGERKATMRQQWKRTRESGPTLGEFFPR